MHSVELAGIILALEITIDVQNDYPNCPIRIFANQLFSELDPLSQADVSPSGSYFEVACKALKYLLDPRPM